MKDSRTVLHEYCGTISDDHFVTPVPGFGRGGSIRNLLVHITNTYNYWIDSHCMKRQAQFTEYESVLSMQDCIALYRQVDQLVEEFIRGFEADYNTAITTLAASASPFKVFSHVTSHEFHHKGQVLTMSRLLGYTPVDTDVIRA